MVSKTQDFLLLIKCYKKNDLQDGTTVQNIETEDFQLNETCFKDREELWTGSSFITHQWSTGTFIIVKRLVE